MVSHTEFPSEYYLTKGHTFAEDSPKKQSIVRLCLTVLLFSSLIGQVLEAFQPLNRSQGHPSAVPWGDSKTHRRGRGGATQLVRLRSGDMLRLSGILKLSH